MLSELIGETSVSVQANFTFPDRLGNILKSGLIIIVLDINIYYKNCALNEKNLCHILKVLNWCLFSNCTKQINKTNMMKIEVTETNFRYIVKLNWVDDNNKECTAY